MHILYDAPNKRACQINPNRMISCSLRKNCIQQHWVAHSEHQGEVGQCQEITGFSLVFKHSALHSDTNLVLLKQQRPLWHVGEVQGGRGGSEGQPRPVAGAVEARPFNLVVCGEGRVTIAPLKQRDGVSPVFRLV